jgi:hypothetical protein
MNGIFSRRDNRFYALFCGLDYELLAFIAWVSKEMPCGDILMSWLALRIIRQPLRVND